MGDDALERLKKRARPTVPSRDASLISTSPDTSTSRNQNLQTSTPQAPQISTPAESVQPLKTKQTTMRLEQEMSDRLQDICRDNGISREVLIEAMFEHCEAEPAVLKAVLAEANRKNEHRQQIANQRRAQSMMKRFGQSEP